MALITLGPTEFVLTGPDMSWDEAFSGWGLSKFVHALVSGATFLSGSLWAPT